jgi:hypothetical protein
MPTHTAQARADAAPRTPTAPPPRTSPPLFHAGTPIPNLPNRPLTQADLRQLLAAGQVPLGTTLLSDGRLRLPNLPPSTTGPGSAAGQLPVTPTRPESVNLRDFLEQQITSRFIPRFVDPQTQQSTASFLSRDNPATFGPQSNLPVDGRNILDANVARERLSKALIDSLLKDLEIERFKASLAPDVLKEFSGEAVNPPKGASDLQKKQIADANTQARLDTKTTLNFLTEALRTGQQGIGGTRAQQRFAQERLNTLFREADKEPVKLGQARTLIENFFNPVVRRAPLSGFIGQSRALTPNTRPPRLGVAFRNPSFT